MGLLFTETGIRIRFLNELLGLDMTLKIVYLPILKTINTQNLYTSAN